MEEQSGRYVVEAGRGEERDRRGRDGGVVEWRTRCWG